MTHIRKKPADGVFIDPSEPTIVFATICTKYRRPWLANERYHQLLRGVWEQARAWLVGRYVIMPDHIHLFAAPGEQDIDFDDWCRYWKRQFSLGCNNLQHRFQSRQWHTRLRRNESYDQKWDYTLNNPVRHGLVQNHEDWPHQGEIFELFW